MLEAQLKQYDGAAWTRACEVLLPFIHEVDRNATRVWFHFFPLVLADAFAQTTDATQLAKTLRLDGRYRLEEQCDTSHTFLYGHRYWPQVTAAIVGHAEPHSPDRVSDNAPDGATDEAPDLPSLARDLARKAAAATGADESLLVGITVVALMTLRQVGLRALLTGGRARTRVAAHGTRTPAQVLAARARIDSQGILGFLRGLQRQHAVTFDESRPDGHFTLISQQHLTTAGASDTRPYTSSRGFSQDGPLPAQCRSGSCGTCWIGILGGAEHLSDVEPLEARRLKECGYLAEASGKPIIRLACMAKASGSVTIAIPPWNGFLTKGGLPET